MFGGFGPIVLGIIYAILESTIENFSLSGTQVLIAIISTYVIAFVQAGATVFKEIERLSTLQAFGIHLISLYLVYVLAYLAIWLTVYLITSRLAKRLTKSIKE